MAHINITPPACTLYATTAENDRCPDVVMVNASASPAQLLGLAHGRCRELAMLAELAAVGDAGESELRQVAEHLWTGLETVVEVLDAMSRRMGGKE